MLGAPQEDDFASKLTPLKSKSEYDALIASGKPVVVDFMAPWCVKVRPMLSCAGWAWPGQLGRRVQSMAPANLIPPHRAGAPA